MERTDRTHLMVSYFPIILLQYLQFLQYSKSQVTTSGLLPLDDPPTFVLSSFGYKLNEVSPQPPLTVEVTVGDPAIPGLDFTGFEYEVKWYAQGEKAARKRSVVRQLTSSGNDVIEKLGFSLTGNKGYKLGDEIYVEFKVRYYRLDVIDSSVQDFSPWSENVISPVYKTGILVSPSGDLEVKECSANYSKITVTLKTPVNYQTSIDCALGIRLFLVRIRGTSFYWTSRQEVALSSCYISLNNSHLNKNLDIYLKGICDSVEEGNDTILLRFEYTQTTYFWNSFHLPEKKIKVFDTSSRWCTYQGDPHMQTFDGLSYSYFGIGDFVLYKNKESGVEVNARLWPCASQGASCICGVAIREGNDILVLKGCNMKKPWKFTVSFKTVAPSSLSSIQVLKELSSSTKFYIFLRSGSELIVTHTYNPEVEKSWVNVMIRVPDEAGVHLGMCGNYDGIPENDLRYGGDGQDYTGDSNGYGESWSLAFDKESWFRKTPTYTIITQRKMCSCGMKAGWWSESKPTLATRCSYNEENHFFVVRRNTEDITKSLRANGRTRRATTDGQQSDLFLEESDSEGEFHVDNFKEYKAIEGLSWPTVSGLTEKEVYDYCRGVIFESSGAQECRDVIQKRSIGNSTVLVENCVRDVQITGEMFWSQSALSTFQSQCDEAILEQYAEGVANETSSIQSDGTQAVLDSLVLVPKEIAPVCPGDCSGNGTCVQGGCVCNDGKTALDCSLDLDRAPVLKGISSDGLCNIRVSACKVSRVDGFGFLNSPGSRLACHVSGFQVTAPPSASNVTWNMSTHQATTSARFIDRYQVQCNLLRHPVSRDGDPYVTGVSTVGMVISVSNDGKKHSNKEKLVIYDGLCLNCTRAGNCVLKNRTCLINGRCYSDGQIHSHEITKSCQPDLSTEQWTEREDNITPRKQTKDTTVIIIAGVVAPSVFLIVLALILRCWILSGSRRGIAEFKPTHQEDDLYFHY